MASIIIMTGPQEGDYHILAQAENILGRSADLPIRILDARIS